jgi:hypothetical protein
MYRILFICSCVVFYLTTIVLGTNIFCQISPKNILKDKCFIVHTSVQYINEKCIANVTVDVCYKGNCERGIVVEFFVKNNKSIDELFKKYPIGTVKNCYHYKNQTDRKIFFNIGKCKSSVFYWFISIYPIVGLLFIVIVLKILYSSHHNEPSLNYYKVVPTSEDF